MNITYRKTWFGKYKITLSIDNFNFNNLEINRNKCKIIKDWLYEFAPYVVFHQTCYGIRDLAITEYNFKLKISEAILFKIRFM